MCGMEKFVRVKAGYFGSCIGYNENVLCPFENSYIHTSAIFKTTSNNTFSTDARKKQIAVIYTMELYLQHGNKCSYLKKETMRYNIVLRNVSKKEYYHPQWMTDMKGNAVRRLA